MQCVSGIKLSTTIPDQLLGVADLLIPLRARLQQFPFGEEFPPPPSNQLLRVASAWTSRFCLVPFRLLRSP